MKIYATLFLLLFFSCQLSAQIYIEGKALEELYSGKYISASISAFNFKKLRAFINYGQQTKPLTNPEATTDKNGETLYFSSTIEALNWFDKNGWELVSSQLGTESPTHYFKRKE